VEIVIYFPLGDVVLLLLSIETYFDSKRIIYFALKRVLNATELENILKLHICTTKAISVPGKGSEDGTCNGRIGGNRANDSSKHTAKRVFSVKQLFQQESDNESNFMF